MTHRRDWTGIYGRILWAVAVLIVLAVIVYACSWQASAQEPDSPTGAPYRVGVEDSSGVSLREAVANALQASKEAVLKAEDAANKRFDSVNEFRQTLTDQAQSFMSKAEADARLKAVEEDISKISSRSEGANNLWIILVAALLVLLNLTGLILNFSKRKEPS